MKRIINRLGIGPKTMLRDLGRKAGLEVRLSTIAVRDDLRLSSFLELFGIDLVLDIGANKGQFAQDLWNSGYRGKIVSFEALPDAHAQLSDAAASSDHSWTVARRVALSDRSGTAQFHVTKADTASSLLSPGKEMVSSSPQTGLAETIAVPTARLDEIIAEMNLPVANCFIKIDVQGAESLVMAGAPDTLAAAGGVMTELSLTSLYDGQPRAQEVLETIYQAGFEVWDIWPGYRNPQTHRLNQIDVVCFKLGEISESPQGVAVLSAGA
ncbi:MULTISPECIES: FkbM family methyltransferase [unclassified Aurantimonas]|uniref:FkbM family methyltransferase n=1 Tax=unclassified Aurantimonas TaxID=2638230 RepID=UPI002E17B1A7|nr:MULTISPECIES: FkbM family methyltransferase [unclassified Aurantimonas]MEC5293426.1 FkbM family methyltransferase [Aurantimonas sp. C2-3-R2]MEC5414513.1 FkbM family methyltransferase [Aurantimonas sp. C2-4-R8]